MKTFIIAIILLAIAYAGVKLSIKSPDQSIPSATEETTGTAPETPAAAAPAPSTEPVSITADRITAEYSGYGPGGKEEHGSVKASKSTLVRTGSIFTGAVTFDMTTITSTPVKDQLIKHLKGADFFDVAKYPTATFTITESTDTQIKGNLTMRGVTKQLTLPVAYNAVENAYTSTVRVNMELFGINQTFTDKEFVLSLIVR